MILTRNEIIETLQTHKCIIKFTKINGEVREMPCTLREDIVPKYDHKTERSKKPNDQVLSVWCLDKNEWRSFRVNSLLEVRLDSSIPAIV
jgi:hypothetical protein